MKNVKVIEKDGKLYFYRLTLNQRIQHLVMFLSFTMLAVTGLPLKFHHTWLGEKIYPLVGGIEYAPIIHRVAAVLMTSVFLYHFLYVIVCAWKYYLRPLKEKGELNMGNAIKSLLSMPMIPNITDIKELITTIKYFLFITNERPVLVSHGLKEKFGYLAVFWGVPVIGLSGYFLWGETFFTRFFSGNVLNFAYIAHSDEAFLASIVIFIWHLYNVHLTPAVFPMGRSWLSGYVGEREIMQYHYAEYVKAMKDAGFENRIRDIYDGAPEKAGFFKKIFIKAYMGVMIVAVIGSTIIICKVIYESVFVLKYQVVSTKPELPPEPVIEKSFMEDVTSATSKKEDLYIGYRFDKENEIEDHFHRVEMKLVPDKVSLCVKCHGDLPHGKSKQVRAFLNMHNLYLDCKVCHVKTGQDGRKPYYYWANRTTGEVVKNPDIGSKRIDKLGIKLMPCFISDGPPTKKDIESQRIVEDDIISRIKNKNLTTEEKKELVKQIHDNLSKQSVTCDECHNSSKQFLNLQEIGYPESRIKAIANDQVTRLVTEYKEFHTPAFLAPGEEK